MVRSKYVAPTGRLSVKEAYASNSVHSLYGNGGYAGTPSVVLVATRTTGELFCSFDFHFPCLRQLTRTEILNKEVHPVLFFL